ncbi:hypothetical protein QBC47DRAFT_417428 [Echria macrotheca]|uniref:J domain-containing protein n=1 Tax=Echria macrotheca TaxID=438768 RepID=A0AAJ0B6X6_9PEZI|nr:hypothetical protein QBC47DRAFT_417428 [Echria macrotheca]
MSSRTYYGVLGVSRNATKGEIRSAYLRLSKIRHPDKNGNSEESTKAFAELASAYETLSDEAKKAEYDDELKRPKTPPPQERARGNSSGGYSSGYGGGYSSRPDPPRSGGRPFGDAFPRPRPPPSAHHQSAHNQSSYSYSYGASPPPHGYGPGPGYAPHPGASYGYAPYSGYSSSYGSPGGASSSSYYSPPPSHSQPCYSSDSECSSCSSDCDSDCESDISEPAARGYAYSRPRASSSSHPPNHNRVFASGGREYCVCYVCVSALAETVRKTRDVVSGVIARFEHIRGVAATGMIDRALRVAPGVLDVYWREISGMRRQALDMCDFLEAWYAAKRELSFTDPGPRGFDLTHAECEQFVDRFKRVQRWNNWLAVVEGLVVKIETRGSPPYPEEWLEGLGKALDGYSGKPVPKGVVMRK